jgi:hypothetical protein
MPSKQEQIANYRRIIADPHTGRMNMALATRRLAELLTPTTNEEIEQESKRLHGIRKELVAKLQKEKSFKRWLDVKKLLSEMDGFKPTQQYRDLVKVSDTLFAKLNKLEPFQYLNNIDYAISNLPKKVLKITKKPYINALLDSFLDNVIDTTGRTIYNPVKKTFIRNTKVNRASVQHQIDRYNQITMKKLAQHIETGATRHSMNNFFNTYTYENTFNAMMFDFLQNPKYKIIALIKHTLEAQLRKHAFKLLLNLSLEFKKPMEEDAAKEVEEYYKARKQPLPERALFYWQDVPTSLQMVKIINANDINQYITEIPSKIHAQLENIQERLKGSGWIFEKILTVQLNLVKYTPTVGGSYIPTPPELAQKKAIINPRNEDNECFKWALLAGLYPVEKNGERITETTKKNAKLFDWSCVSFPTTIDKIDAFEERHPDVSINVYQYEERDPQNKVVVPLRLTKSLTDKHVNLLLLEDGEKSHYTLIKNYSRLFSSQLRNHHGAIFPCYYCNKPCSSAEVLQRHMTTCQHLTTHEEPKPKMPEVGDILKFKNWNNKFKAPFALVADFESILPKAEENNKNLKQEHKPCSFGINMVTDFDEHRMSPTFYLGKDDNDTMSAFFNTLEMYAEYVFRILRREEKMNLTDEQTKEYKKAKVCHICEQLIKPGQVKVRDHCHITGEYRGAAHQDCNVNFNYKNFKLPVVIHNLKNYDAHFIIQYCKRMTYKRYNKKTEETEDKEVPISVIANNQEKYMSFTIGRLKFIDSFQFLSSSLEKLTDNLKLGGYDNFKYTKRYMGDHWQMACEKGIYPYEYMDSFDRFKETQLPPKEKFYSALNESGINDEDYAKAKHVWQTLNMQTMKDYHDFYLKCDVFLLSDVFDTFRNAMLTSHKLDPIHYITLPSFSWDAALKQSKIELELLTEYEMHCMVEKGIRGGISVIAHRHAKANNKYMSMHDASKESSYIIYLDANNLYGEAMSQPLPFKGFQWCNDKFNVAAVNANPAILNTSENEGYILEVDMEYPAELHDTHNDFPLAVESMQIKNSMLTEWTKNQQKLLGLKENKTNKLCATFTNKEKYVLHSRNLQYYLEKGMRLTAIHRIIRFDQKPWLKEYIDVNTQLRKKAKTDFEKDLYKLLNNAVFGKTMENVRGRIEYEIVQSPKRARTITQSPKFKTFTIINEDMTGVQSHKAETHFNKPIYCGLAILDLSKLHMYRFHYEHMKPKYGDNIKLLAQDTDSLIYHIKTDDLYQDMSANKDQYDFGSYPKDHFLYDPTNNKVQGKFKDETSGIPIAEFVGLAPKMYSIKLDTGKVKGTAKGVKKTYYKNHITHDDYLRCITSSKLEDMRQTAKFLNFRSIGHKIGTYEINKYSLSNYDNKRAILEDGVSSLAYGHYRLNQN